MKIALIHASPKAADSASGILLELLASRLPREAVVLRTALHTPSVSPQALEQLREADLWVFSLPLYVDSVPGHLLSCLLNLEGLKPKRERRVYGIVNCGFYEGIQAEPALLLLQNWCRKAGLIWSGGAGIGGGGCLTHFPSIKEGRGPVAGIRKTLQVMADSMMQGKQMENSYVSVGMPRSLYKLAAEMGWRNQIRTNGGRTADLGKQPD